MVKINLGRLSFRLTRLQGHAGKFSFCMMLYLTLDKLNERFGVSFWWGLLIIPLLMFVSIFDFRHVWPSESNMSASTIPWNQQLMGKVDAILKILGTK